MLHPSEGQEEPESGQWQRLRERLDGYFHDVPANCPYGLPQRAVYHQGPFTSQLPDDLVGQFLESGFRRNGNCLYRMACPECRECQPIRLHPATFLPNRSQRRVWRKNSEVMAEIGPVQITAEKLAICDAFLAGRYPGKKTRALDYYGGFFANVLCHTVEIRYRVKGRLLGVAIVDVSCEWLSAVYFYFDPAEASRSPGTYNILFLIDFCQRQNIPLLYLGYWIEAVPAMAYKASFRPHALRLNDRWVATGPGTSRP
jgi:arginine-tRNA-protein transferase